MDQLGRDVFSRVVHGAHIVLLLSLSGTALGLAIGAALGLLSGYVGGWIDNFIQRLLETLISIPFLVLALLAIASAGPELSGHPLLVVLVGAGLCAAHRPHGAGRGDRHRHPRLRDGGAAARRERVVGRAPRILPNASSVLLVEFALRAGYAPVLIGSLGFLGFGLGRRRPNGA